MSVFFYKFYIWNMKKILLVFVVAFLGISATGFGANTSDLDQDSEKIVQVDNLSIENVFIQGDFQINQVVDFNFTNTIELNNVDLVIIEINQNAFFLPEIFLERKNVIEIKSYQKPYSSDLNFSKRLKKGIGLI